jgi:hypothetical protein
MFSRLKKDRLSRYYCLKTNSLEAVSEYLNCKEGVLRGKNPKKHNQIRKAKKKQKSSERKKIS